MRVTDNIPQIISFIKTIIASGQAYATSQGKTYCKAAPCSAHAQECSTLSNPVLGSDEIPCARLPFCSLTDRVWATCLWWHEWADQLLLSFEDKCSSLLNIIVYCNELLSKLLWGNPGLASKESWGNLLALNRRCCERRACKAQRVDLFWQSWWLWKDSSAL